MLLAALSVASGCASDTSPEADGATSSAAEIPALDASCSTDDDCTDPALPRCLNVQCVDEQLAQQWLCDTEEVSQGRDQGATIQYSFGVIELSTTLPPEAFRVRACLADDRECSEPLDVFNGQSDDATAQLTLPKGFQGYFEVEGPGVPTLLWVTKPIEQDTHTRDLPLLSQGAIQVAARLAGVDLETDTGLVMIEAIDCSMRPAGGVQFKLPDSGAVGFYLVDAVPNTEIGETIYNENDNTAGGGFVNVPPGTRTFSAHLGTDGMELQSSSVVVRSNWVTFVEMRF